MLYINGQDIARLSLGLLNSDFTWAKQPQTLDLNPEAYLSGVDNYLKANGLNKTQISGLAVAAGPGSATSLRTSHALVNALGFALKVPVWSVPELDKLSHSEVTAAFSQHQAHAFALPEYARAPQITESTRDQLKRKQPAKTYGQYGQHRFLEMLPGLLSWGVIIAAVVSAFFAPTIAVVFIIIFDLYWMLRVFYFVIHVIVAYRQYRRYLNIDWYVKLTQLPNWDSVYHVVMLPTYQEDLPILEEAMESLLRVQYRKDRLIVMVGGEERDEAKFKEHAEALQARYQHKFADLIFTIHPKNLPGEIPGKGSNMKHMGQEFQKYLVDKPINPDDIIVSAFDIDTIAHPQYFACLAYLFRTIDKPHRSSYQPITLFSNNIWSATAPVRVAAFGTVFWLLSELVRPERMWTFSSHSMSWKMLVDVGFWEPDLVSEDSRIFMQGFLRYDGDYRVTPIFLPVSMDAVAEGTYLKSLGGLYKQQRRWAWGVEHIPYMLTQFKKHPNLPRRLKFKYVFNHFEGMFTWATAPFLIFVLGYLPFLAVGYAESALLANSPYTLEFMMRGATLGVFVTGALSFFLLPSRPSRYARWNWLLMLMQWLLLPVTFILFGAIPALDAQTRLMLGKYLGFNVTSKNSATRAR